MQVSLNEKAPDFRTLKYEWSLPDFWKLKFTLESRDKILKAKMLDEQDKLTTK
jgi:hypothetical protein